MSRFTTTPLAGGQVLIEGTDVRGKQDQEVVDGRQWAEVKARGNQAEALALVDAAIEALVAPITEAVEQANAMLAAPKLDPLFYVVEQEEVEHTHGRPELLTKLSRDSVILRAIEEGHEDRLIWIKGSLTVTAESVVATPAPVPPADGSQD